MKENHARMNLVLRCVKLKIHHFYTNSLSALWVCGRIFNVLALHHQDISFDFASERTWASMEGNPPAIYRGRRILELPLKGANFFV